jgi:chemotaxis protein CheX
MAIILLVEDDQALADSYTRILAEIGHRVVRASDGQEATLKVRNQSFDLIITDLNMPKVSGKQFIDVLQDAQGSFPCPLIICSGFIDNRIIDDFGSHGKVHFLPKPTSTKELVWKVTSLLTAVPKTSVDVRFVNPVLNATMEILLTMTGFEIRAGKPFVKKPDDPSGDISGVVGVVSSGFKGTISLSFSESAFLRVLSKMLKEECAAINDENKDAVAELLNIIFGKAKKVLNEAGMNIQPAIPSIIHGKSHVISHHSKHPTIVIPFSAPELGEFRSEISSSG